MQITDLEINVISAYDNEKYEGFTIGWDSNIGFGECSIFREKDKVVWKAATEHMGRDFLKMLLNKLADTVAIIE